MKHPVFAALVAVLCFFIATTEEVVSCEITRVHELCSCVYVCGFSGYYRGHMNI